MKIYKTYFERALRNTSTREARLIDWLGPTLELDAFLKELAHERTMYIVAETLSCYVINLQTIYVDIRITQNLGNG